MMGAWALVSCGSSQEAGDTVSSADTTSVEAADPAPDEDTQPARTRADRLDPDRPREIEAVMAFEVGGDPSGCGYEPVTEFEGVYYRTGAYLDHEGFIDGGEIGWPLIFCLPEGQTWTVTANRPDGEEETTEGLTLEYGREFVPGDPLGTWTFRAESNGESLEVDIDVGNATESRITSIGDDAFTAHVGDVVSYSLVGFDPDATLPVGIYQASEQDYPNGDFVGLLHVETDPTGAAILELIVPDTLGPGHYFLVPDPASEESKAVSVEIASRLRAELYVS